MKKGSTWKMSKHKDTTILKVKLLESGEVATMVKEKHIDLLPSCVKLLLATLIGISLQNGAEPTDIMKDCKDILEQAWEENGVDWLIEHIDTEQDRKDRMGL